MKLVYSAFPQFQARDRTYAFLSRALEYRTTSKLEGETLFLATFIYVQNPKSVCERHNSGAKDVGDVYADRTIAGFRPLSPIKITG